VVGQSVHFWWKEAGQGAHFARSPRDGESGIACLSFIHDFDLHFSHDDARLFAPSRVIQTPDRLPRDEVVGRPSLL
jgi:hypothetical protein